MKIHSVDFIGAIGQVGQAAPEAARELPQVAFSGRSNVGKSTLINHLLGRTRSPIARVSQQPGKTQEINFYHVRSDLGEFCLVDLPGYGYAKVPAALREKWRPLIEGYMSTAAMAGVVQLIDIRRGATPDDLKSIEYLAELGVPTLFALTKADKLKPTRRKEAVGEIVQALAADADQVLPVSALSGDGIEDLRDTVGALLFPAPSRDDAA
jgi:GTP-binding protein